MSKIGKMPIEIPDGVDVKVDGDVVQAKGPKGSLEFELPQNIGAEVRDKMIAVLPVKKEPSVTERTMWGTARSRVNNIVVGVSEGFMKKLEINGVGYKAAVQGRKMTLNLGYSHPIEFEAPEGVDLEVKKSTIVVSGADKEQVGAVAAKIRSYRKPEPYKGKGIKYSDEVIIRKEGKKAAAAEGGTE